jgi:hypothetical protein
MNRGEGTSQASDPLLGITAKKLKLGMMGIYKNGIVLIILQS